MYTAINFLLPDPDTGEGKALRILGETCKECVIFLEGHESDAAMAKSMSYGIEERLYKVFDDREIPDYQPRRKTWPFRAGI